MIPFLDLSLIHKPIKDEVMAAIERVYDSGRFVLGKEVDAFEREFAAYIGGKYCIGAGNGLDALGILLTAYGIGPSDEVIIPANTYIATALAVSRTGATPVLVEPDTLTYNIDPCRIEKAINKNTKAIIAVHLYGQPCDMHTIMEIAQRYGLMVLEDNAQAQGAEFHGRKTGNLSHASATSFYPGKNIGALGDGGAIVVNDSDIAKKCRTLCNYGSDEKYYNKYKGNNSRLDEMQAAVLRVKLKYLDSWNDDRIRIANAYSTGISNPLITLPAQSPSCKHVWHQYVVTCSQRDQLQSYLKGKGIETLIHYPVPIHAQEAYSELACLKCRLTIAENLSNTVLSLPIYPYLEYQTQKYIIETINSFSGE